MNHWNHFQVLEEIFTYPLELGNFIAIIKNFT